MGKAKTKVKVKVYDNKDHTGPLEPPDPKRCQFERNEYHPFTMGGSVRRTIRCEAVPIVIATERIPMDDGRRGQMSLCGEHRDLLKREAPGVATFEPIPKPVRQRQRASSAKARKGKRKGPRS